VSAAPFDPETEATELVAFSVGWTDRWYDPASHLLWNPPGSFAGELPDVSVHLLPTSAWYAFGLLERGAAGDRDRAVAVLDAVLDAQYDRPGTVWHGTFSRFAEWPEPGDGNDAIEWFDYDPNWRQFIGTTLLLTLRHHEADLPAELLVRIDRALRLAVEGETDRVDARYTNIALMKAVLEVEAGERLGEPAWVEQGHALADAVVARFDRTGTFDEYNSPTYYGIDLVGLSLWRTCPVGAHLREVGRRVELALWRDIAAWVHPGLGNLCGPFTRSYGMDMQRYVAALSMWMWPLLGRAAAPLPDLTAEVIEHGHDLPLGPVAARLTNHEDRDLVARAFAEVGTDQPRRVDRVLHERPRRTAAGWIGADLMVGVEDNELPWHAWLQYHPVTVHWRAPGGGADPGAVGTVRLHADAHVDGRIEVVPDAGDDTVVVHLEVAPHPVRGPQPVSFTGVRPGLDPGAVRADAWGLPGLHVEVVTDARLTAATAVDPERLEITYAPAEGTTGPTAIELRLRSRAHPG
jgi:hypothetical protein